ncbi:hypothetical protein FB451DRAFT_1188906 [Mycena latifolia]|nr:hypothetical protein FB451DRAFT_1188906 [Mycena latifolia]
MPSAVQTTPTSESYHTQRENSDARSISASTVRQQFLQHELRAAQEKMVDLEELERRTWSTNATEASVPSRILRMLSTRSASTTRTLPGSSDLVAQLRERNEAQAARIRELEAQMNFEWALGLSDDPSPGPLYEWFNLAPRCWSNSPFGWLHSLWSVESLQNGSVDRPSPRRSPLHYDLHVLNYYSNQISPQSKWSLRQKQFLSTHGSNPSRTGAPADPAAQMYKLQARTVRQRADVWAPRSLTLRPEFAGSN